MESFSLAREKCLTYGRYFKKDAVYSIRRAEMESRMESLTLPSGWDTKVEKTTSTHYASLTSDDVTIIAYTRGERPLWLRPAAYWETSTERRQLDIFEYPELTAGNRLLAVYVYGGGPDAAAPSFAEFVFPDSRGWLVHERIDLLAEYPAISGRNAGATPNAEPTVEVDDDAAAGNEGSA